MSASIPERPAPLTAQTGLTHVASSAKWQDSLFHALTFSFAALVLAILMGIVISLILEIGRAHV